MCLWILTLWTFLFGCSQALTPGDASYGTSNELPSWLVSNPAFANPTIINAKNTGGGCVNSTKKENLSWLVHLNEDRGYGIEISLDKLAVNSNSNGYLLIAAWPIVTTKFKEIKLFTGTFTKSQIIHIPNSKSFFLLFSSPGPSSEFNLAYKRYGISYEPKPPTTESPVKKETLYDVAFKGRSPKDFHDVDFQRELKEVIRAIAERFCLANQIKFDKNITANEMVYINRISYCPFEWPDRDICASIEHSVFVSGVKVPGEFIIMDYELTSDNLKKMWAQGDLEELEKLKLTVYHLPEASSTILWWALIIGVAVFSTLIGIVVFWTVEKHSKDFRKMSSAISSIAESVRPKKKSKLKLSPHQQVPSFMYHPGELDEEDKKLAYSDHKFVKADAGPQGGGAKAPMSPPIQNYFGSILFSSNKAFEDDEDVNVEFPPPPQTTKR